MSEKCLCIIDESGSLQKCNIVTGLEFQGSMLRSAAAGGCDQDVMAEMMIRESTVNFKQIQSRVSDSEWEFWFTQFPGREIAWTWLNRSCDLLSRHVTLKKAVQWPRAGHAHITCESREFSACRCLTQQHALKYFPWESFTEYVSINGTKFRLDRCAITLEIEE